MDKETVLNLIEDDVTFFEPEEYFEAVIGLTTDGRLVYSREKIIGILMDVNGMTNEEAEEWVEFNMVRTLPYMGEKHPEILYEL